ncbi:hypothetical protein [Verrucomicrobium spinosum]|uniref:hypothetical protein n=1 Tax=Verrucomicrobium spinosum TaxID=2736 RepID=UPI000AB900B9|nr:hypothetical protein [Verrucomicrobium spinosum]
MPQGRITIVDAMQPHLVLGNIVEENVAQTPELGVIPVRVLESGIRYNTLAMVELPTTGFRKLGEGMPASKGRYEPREHKCFLFGGRVEVERAAAAADAGGMSAIEARATRGVMLSALATLGPQIFYGTDRGADGFQGLKAFTPFGGAYTKNATGTTASTATSVFGVKLGEDYAELIAGQGNVFDLGEFRDQDILGTNNKPLPGRVADLEAGSVFSSITRPVPFECATSLPTWARVARTSCSVTHWTCCLWVRSLITGS